MTTLRLFETDIRNGLYRLLQFLEIPESPTVKENFLQTGPRVLQAFEALLDAMADQHPTLTNLGKIFKEVENCHFLQVNVRIASFVDLVHVGVQVYGATLGYSGDPNVQKIIDYEAKVIEDKSAAIQRNLEKIKQDCGNDVNQQNKDLQTVLEESATLNNNETAHKLYNYFSETYPSKMWAAIVHSDGKSHFKQWSNLEIYNYVYGGKIAGMVGTPHNSTPLITQSEFDEKFQLPKYYEYGKKIRTCIKGNWIYCWQSDDAESAIVKLDEIFPGKGIWVSVWYEVDLQLQRNPNMTIFVKDFDYLKVIAIPKATSSLNAPVSPLIHFCFEAML